MPPDLILLSIAGLFSGISSLGYKKIATLGFSPKTATVVVMLVNAFLAIPLLFYEFYVSDSIYYWGLILASTVAFAFSTYFSFKAYELADVSVVSIIYRFNIVLVALLGIWLLKESYSAKAYLGLALILLSSLLFIFEEKKVRINVGIIYAWLMAGFAAVASVLDKVVLNDFSPYTYAFFNNLLIGLVFAFSLHRLKEGKKLLEQNKRLVFLTALFNLIAFVIVLVVLGRTNVSKTLPVYKAFSLLAPVLLGILVFGERKKLPQKIVGSLLGLMGILLVY